MEQQYIVDESGKKTAVVLSIEDYERLIEDLHDLRMAAERRDDPSVSLSEVKARPDGKRKLRFASLGRSGHHSTARDMERILDAAWALDRS